MLPKDCKHQLTAKDNNVDSSILHEVTASDTMKNEATKMVETDPELLLARNKLGETPIFCAAQHGQTEMFKFLAGKMKLDERSPEDAKQYLRRNDKTTVLHISVVIECFDEFIRCALNSSASYIYSISISSISLILSLVP